MKNIVIRAISGAIYIALIIGSLIAGPIWFTALTALFALLAVWEFHSVTSNRDGKRNVIQTIALALDIAASVTLVMMTEAQPVTFIGLVLFAIATYTLLRLVLALYDKSGNALVSTFRSAMSLLYIGVPLAILSFTNRFYSGTEHVFGLVMLMFVMIWLNDTGAYCVGCTLGKHRLCERLSPKKSWEGFWGGMLFAVGAGAAYGLTIGTVRGVGFYMVMGAVVSLFATWGDLFESLIKRTSGVKDSGKIMPGHGGILDRIDSLLFVAPATLIYLTIAEMAVFAFNLVNF